MHLQVLKQKIPLFSIRSRIIFTFTIITVLLVGLFSRLAYLTAREIYLEQLSEELELLLQVVTDRLEMRYLDLLTGGQADTKAEQFYRRFLKQQTALLHVNALFLFNLKGELLVQVNDQTTVTPRPALLIYHRELEELPVGTALTSLPFKGKDGAWYLWSFQRLSENHYLGAREGLQRLARIDAMSHLFWGIGITGVLLTLLAGWLVARSLSRPVEKLVDFSTQLGKGEFSAKTPQGISRELQILANAMDRMRHDLANYHRERENMLAQIAHEIRNPLGSIELLSGLLEEDLRQNHMSTEYARKIREEISGLKSLITAYLNYSRPPQANPEWLDVNEMVNQVAEFFHPQFQKRKIHFQVKHQIAAEIRFDPGHLQQVLSNLLHNSLAACKTGGEITVTIHQNNNALRIEVMDNGTGISGEIRDRIFEPFFSTRTDGSGLGLPICRKLCQENEARIFLADGTPGQCTFVVETEYFRIKGKNS